MGPTWWLVTRWARRRWWASLPVALIVAIGGTGTMLALSAADRTSNAYADFVDRADVGDVVINPAVATQQVADVIRNLPGVERMTMSALLTVSFEEGKPGPRPSAAVADVIDENTTFILASHDGRYFDMDRPVLRSGRMPTGRSEAVITPETAAAIGLDVGDVVPMSFWQFGLADGLRGEALERFLIEDVGPIGVEHVTIVGVVTLPDEVLPDGLYPRQRVILSPDLAARYDCLPREPRRGLTLAETVKALLPDECAFAQHYFSLEVDGGSAGVKRVLDEFVRVTAPMNRALLDISDLGDVPGNPPQYFLIPTETELDLERADRAVRPTVITLVVLGLAAAAITVALATLAVWRELQRTHREQQQWHQLGMRWTSRAVVVALPMTIAALAGAVVAIAGSWFLGTGPIGLVSAMEPDPERRLDASALVALLSIVLVTVAIVVFLATLWARRIRSSTTQGVSGSGGRPFAVRIGPPVVAEGVRAAYQDRAALPVLAGAAIATATFVAALSFGTSLSTLLSTPRSYGWPWDVAAMTGGGYGDLDVMRAQQLLDTDPDVRSWTYLGFVNQVSLDGEPMTAVIVPDNRLDTGLTLLEGRFPVGADEVAIGATTADNLDIDVGDTVDVGAFVDSRPSTVTGIVVFPTIGPFGSDRVSIGTGLLLPDSLFDSDDPAAGSDFVNDLSAFVGVKLHDEATTPVTISRLRAELGKLDRNGVPAVTYGEPVRPAEIIDAENIRSLPLKVGITFAVVGAIGFAVALWASTRARRRELAVLQSLGFSTRQIRHTVWVQSIATMIGALVVGVPLGIIAGRVSWRTFASYLGVVPDPASPIGPVLVSVLGGILIAFVAGQLPAHIAAGADPAVGLRAE